MRATTRQRCLKAGPASWFPPWPVYFHPSQPSLHRRHGQSTRQNYIGIKVFTISGKVIEGQSGPGLPGVVLNGPPEYTVTDENGFYTATVYQGWEGAVTPILTGYRFTPNSINYPSVIENQLNKDYIADPVPTYILSGFVRKKAWPCPG